MSEFDVMTAELEVARKLFWLLRQDHVYLASYSEEKETWDDGAYPVISCNDLFVPGADGESLREEDLDDFIAVVKKWPNAGDAAWCAVKRSAKLWRRTARREEWQKEFDEAVAGIPALLTSRKGPKSHE